MTLRKDIHKLASKNALLVATILTFGITNPVFALQMEASAEWTFNGGDAAPNSPDIDGPASSGFVDVLSGDNDSNGNSVFYHTFGNENGYFGSRTSGNGNFDITGTFNFQENYTANGGTAFFTFDVIPGEIQTNLNSGVTLAAGEELFASYSLNIFLNGNSIWDSSAEILETSAGVNFSFDGTSLNGTESGSEYRWGNYTQEIDLGDFLAGDLIDISYELVTSAHSTLISSADRCGNGDGFDGDGDGFDGDRPVLARIAIVDDGPGFNQTCGGATARIGDPNGLTSGLLISGATSAASTVPTPGVLTLLSIGLVGLGFSRRSVRA